MTLHDAELDLRTIAYIIGAWFVGVAIIMTWFNRAGSGKRGKAQRKPKT